MAGLTVEENENLEMVAPSTPSKETSNVIVVIDDKSPESDEVLNRKAMTPIAEEEMQLEQVDDSRETRESSSMFAADTHQSFTDSVLQLIWKFK